MTSSPVTESELHAYVDGVLPAARCAEIQHYLAAHPEEASRIAAYQAQNAALHALFDPVLAEPIPTRLRDVPGVTRARSWHLQRYAAGFLIALVGGLAGWILHGTESAEHVPMRVASTDATALTASSFAHQAAIAHVVYSPDLRHPVEVGADQEAHLVSWLSNRLGTPINPPKLGKLGYSLVGGRLLPGQSGPVAQFMYQDSDAQRLTLYVSNQQSQNKDTGFQFSEQGPVNVFYWIDGRFGYALSGSVDRAVLSRIAEAVYFQIDKAGAGQ